MPGCYGPMATNLGCDPRFSPYGCSGCMGCGCGMPGMGCTPGMTPGRIRAGNSYSCETLCELERLIDTSASIRVGNGW